MTETALSVPWSQVEQYLGAGQATTYPLSRPGSRPQVSYVIEHGGRDIALHVQLVGKTRPPHATLPTIQIDQLADRGSRFVRIRTTRADLVREFHDFLCAVADRILTHGRTLDQAYAETVRAWSALLNRPASLSLGQRLGLIGELAVLRCLAGEYGWATAVEAWTGPDGEECDFGLPDCDLEVKTTSSEQRRHRIHGIAQLDPAPGRRLWFASLQLTRGGADGRTLNDLARAVRREVAEQAPASLGSLDRGLAAAGWSEEAPDDERWTLRTPLLVLDAATLPRIDLSALPEAAWERISSVQYTLDVTGLPSASQYPSALADFRLQ
ncbi:PD-(D/E)XK motif protein [Streptomyces alfalfae]|uniref:PD-(D/E)XK motif protein n=1 Tax=Streptomyces alfalfae TaxID=1642299 RepID=A0A7T4PGA4_9ACTN|nr:PD-(D/E)XK motif protein [Streptomyces alfalfae]QQC89473.1 PD-(D/E)XK motif protein [Streptomyces alfalfae]